MLVSIIVPVYKVEKYLSTCVESILRQTFTCFELILVDDGSPDECGKICDLYAKKDCRVKVVHKKNGGLSDARNCGIEIACGDFLTFIDSDDFVFPRYLEYLVDSCLKSSADMSVCSFVRCSIDDSYGFVEEKPMKGVDVVSEEKMKLFFTSKKINTVAWGKIYKRYLFENIRFPLGKYNEDVFTTYKIIHIAKKIAICDYVGYVYRMNGNSIINEVYSPKKLDSIEGCLERARFIEECYPILKRYAYRDVIYSCNQTLISMGRSQKKHDEALMLMQPVYRRYVFSYLTSKCSLMGKVFAVVSFFNVSFGFYFAARMSRNHA